MKKTEMLAALEGIDPNELMGSIPLIWRRRVIMPAGHLTPDDLVDHMAIDKMG